MGADARRRARQATSRGVDGVVWFMRVTPRKAALVWSLFCWSRVVAYWDTVPKQLERVHFMTPDFVHLWMLWAVPAILLLAGSLPEAIPYGEKVVRLCRVLGGVAAASMLSIWAVAFFEADSNRSWVSASNYVFLAIGALTTSQTLGRKHSVSPGEVIVR